MALLGVGLAGLVAAVAAAVLFARLVRDSLRPNVAAVSGAFFAVADVVSGRTTFALGAVAALAALVLLPHRRWAVTCAALTGLLSPVAAAFLGLAAAVLVLHRRPGGWSIGLACSIPVALLAALFHGGGQQPFSPNLAIPAFIVAVGLAVVTTTPEVRTGAWLLAIATVLVAVPDNPIGSNIVRISTLLAVPVLLAVSRRSTAVLVASTLGLLVWQLDPTRDDLRYADGPPTKALTSQLVELGSQRAEVLAVRDHRESYAVAAKVPLARGWYRQLDASANPLFYHDVLEPQEYVDWLHENAVDHVAVPRYGSLDYGSGREGVLLRDPVPGLREVWRNDGWVVLEVEDPQPIADGEVLASTRTHLEVRVQPGTVRVRVRWSRWLSVDGPACLAHEDDEVVLRVREAGTVTVGSSLRPRGHC